MITWWLHVVDWSTLKEHFFLTIFFWEEIATGGGVTDDVNDEFIDEDDIVPDDMIDAVVIIFLCAIVLSLLALPIAAYIRRLLCRERRCTCTTLRLYHM